MIRVLTLVYTMMVICATYGVFNSAVLADKIGSAIVLGLLIIVWQWMLWLFLNDDEN